MFYCLIIAWFLVILNIILNYLNATYLFENEFSIFISLLVIVFGLFAIGLFCLIKYKVLGIYMFIIPFIVSIIFITFKCIFGINLIDINYIELITWMADNNDEGIDVKISKETIKETAVVVSEGVNRFTVNTGGYGTAAVAAGIQKVVTSGAPLGAKAVGVLGLSAIGMAGALTPAHLIKIRYLKSRQTT